MSLQKFTIKSSYEQLVDFIAKTTMWDTSDKLSVMIEKIKLRESGKFAILESVAQEPAVATELRTLINEKSLLETSEKLESVSEPHRVYEVIGFVNNETDEITFSSEKSETVETATKLLEIIKVAVETDDVELLLDMLQVNCITAETETVVETAIVNNDTTVNDTVDENV